MPKHSPFKVFVFFLDAVLQVLLVVWHLSLMMYHFSNLRPENNQYVPLYLEPLFHMSIAGIYQFVVSNIFHYSLGVPTPILAHWRKMYILTSFCVLFLTFSTQFAIGAVMSQCCVYVSCAVAVLEYLALVKQNKVEEMP